MHYIIYNKIKEVISNIEEIKIIKLRKIYSKDDQLVKDYIKSACRYKSPTTMRDELNTYLDKRVSKFTIDEIGRICLKIQRNLDQEELIKKLVLNDLNWAYDVKAKDPNCNLGNSKATKYILEHRNEITDFLVNGREIVVNNQVQKLYGAWGLSAYLYIQGKFITGDVLIKIFRRMGIDLKADDKKLAIEIGGPRYKEQLDKRSRNKNIEED